MLGCHTIPSTTIQTQHCDLTQKPLESYERSLSQRLHARPVSPLRPVLSTWLPGEPRAAQEGCMLFPLPGALASLSSLPTPCHLRTYWALSRIGPKSAPRIHMGRPVWTASNHFTTISPGGGNEVGGEQGPGGEASGAHGRAKRGVRSSLISTRGQQCLVPARAGPRGTWLGVEESPGTGGNRGWEGGLGAECGGLVHAEESRPVPTGLRLVLRVSEQGALALECCHVSEKALGGGGDGGRDVWHRCYQEVQRAENKAPSQLTNWSLAKTGEPCPGSEDSLQ